VSILLNVVNVKQRRAACHLGSSFDPLGSRAAILAVARPLSSPNSTLPNLLETLNGACNEYGFDE